MEEPDLVTVEINLISFISELIIRIISRCPLHVLSSMGDCAGSLLPLIDRRHRMIVRKRIQRVFGKGFPAEELTARFYRHLGRLALELPFVYRINSSNVREFFDTASVERFRAALEQGKGLIILTGHLGNWELTGASVSACNIPVHAVAKKQKPEFFHDILTRIRQRSGQRIVEKDGAFRKMVRLLRDNQVVAILMDHDVRSKGIFVPFLGIEASTLPTAAYLSLMSGAPIMVACAFRTQNCRFRLHISEPLEWDPEFNSDRDVAIQTIVRKINDQLGSFIRKQPDQWLWLQNRWKSMPDPIRR